MSVRGTQNGRTTRRVAFVLLLLLSVLLPNAQSAPAQDGSVAPAARDGMPGILETGAIPRGVRAAEVGPAAGSRSIVVLRPDAGDPWAIARELESAHGLTLTHVYAHLLRGFTAVVPVGSAAALAADPRIERIEPDRELYRSAQRLPTGINRIDADRNSVARIDGSDRRVDATVAVLDGGVDWEHPDLNVVEAGDCTGEGIFGDADGHGTHVAGTIAALDNGIGVVGVAPGARIWSIRVVDSSGFATEGSVLCAMEVIWRNAGSVDVVNISLGGPGADGSCESVSLHWAICDVVAAGVTIVVAAGNERINAAGISPANYNQVITVSALADSDGKRGGSGPATTAGRDDSFASFSNFGADVDLAAPGVDILSTFPGGGSATASGTSMAAPHVAGAAALYIATHGRVGPAAVRGGLIAEREAVALAGDPDGRAEGVVDAGDGWSPPTTVCTISPTGGVYLTIVTATCSGFRTGETVELFWDATTAKAKASFTAGSGGRGTAAFRVPSAKRGSHNVLAKGRSSGRTATARFSVRPTMIASPTSGPSGTTVTVKLYGFGSREQVTLRWYRTTTASSIVGGSPVTASSTGSATLTFAIPSRSTAGSHKIEATGTAGNAASKTFSVTVPAAATATQTPPPPPTAPATSTATATNLPTATNTPIPVPTATATAVPAPPGAPTWPPGSTVTASEATFDDQSLFSLTLSWTSAASDQGVAEYRLYQDGSLLLAVDGATLGASVGPLTPGATYGFTVQACDAAGNCSADGPGITVTMPGIA